MTRFASAPFATVEELRAAVRSVPSPIDATTAGANPLREGGFSPPLWHCLCRWCGERWTFQRWKHDALMNHPANGCLWFHVHEGEQP